MSFNKLFGSFVLFSVINITFGICGISRPVLDWKCSNNKTVLVYGTHTDTTTCPMIIKEKTANEYGWTRTGILEGVRYIEKPQETICSYIIKEWYAEDQIKVFECKLIDLPVKKN